MIRVLFFVTWAAEKSKFLPYIRDRRRISTEGCRIGWEHNGPGMEEQEMVKQILGKGGKWKDGSSHKFIP